MKPSKLIKIADQNLQNKINCSIVFNYLRKHWYTSRAEISKGLNISAPTLLRIVEKLIKDGYIIKSGEIKTGSGKKATW